MQILEGLLCAKDGGGHFIVLFPYNYLLGYPGGSDSKEFACNAGDLGSIHGLGRSPGEVNGYPFRYFLPGESHGQRILAGYSPWGHK